MGRGKRVVQLPGLPIGPQCDRWEAAVLNEGANEPEGTLKGAVVDINVSLDAAHLEVLQEHLRKDADFLIIGVKIPTVASGLLALVDVLI